MHERTTHILLDESLSHVVKNRPNEHRDGIVILKRQLEIHPLLENAKKSKVKTLKESCGMICESDNLDSVGCKLF
jgi:hypothetical protein